LPKEQKECEPGNQVLRASKTPIVRQDGAELRILAGSYGDQKAPIHTSSPLLMMDVKIEPNSTSKLTLPGDFFVGTYVLSGDGQIGNQSVEPFSIALSKPGSPSTTELVCTSGTRGLRFLLFSGARINDPLDVDGFFVCCSPHQTERAVKDFEERTGSFAAGNRWHSKIAHPK
jgi:hypothetical protein